MGIGVGLFLIAVGAVLTWAVNATVNGVDINTVGVILMIVGAVGLVLDLIIFAPRRSRSRTMASGMPPAGVSGGTVYQEHDTYV
ncbi:MAG: DUF6458 family protein [Mycobacteriales bacterium]